MIYANYADCDPLTLGYITKIDEIVPFYVENTFKDIPGIIGIFMAALCNGSLRYLTVIKKTEIRFLKPEKKIHKNFIASVKRRQMRHIKKNLFLFIIGGYLRIKKKKNFIRDFFLA